MSDSTDELIEIPNTQEYVEEHEEVELSLEEEDVFVEIVKIGFKQTEIEFYGHTAIISTLNDEEEIGLGFTLEEFQKLPTMSRAYKTCIVAASLREIDGNPLYIPLNKKERVADTIKAKFNIIKLYSPILIDYLYDQVKILQSDVANIWTKLGKGSS